MSDKSDSRTARSPAADSRMNSEARAPVPRFQYTEYELSDATVAMIRDISEPTAWVQSNVTCEIKQ